MPTFIDESGDIGVYLNATSNSSSHFHIVAVTLPNPKVVEDLRQAIQELRLRLGMKKDAEFKFAKKGKLTHQQKEAFYKTVMSFEFQFAGVSIDKLPPSLRNVETVSYHWATAVGLAYLLEGVYRKWEEKHDSLLSGKTRFQELVVVDNNQDHDLLRFVEEEFKRIRCFDKPEVPLINKVRFQGSHTDEMIQLADMLVGAIRLWSDGDSHWFSIVKQNCVGVLWLN
jgi:hypothetical protein